MTANRLRELVDYDPDTGVFVWKISTSNRVKVGEVAGCRRRDGYVLIRLDGKLYLAHRLAWMYVHGEWPKHGIDHIDRDKSNRTPRRIILSTYGTPIRRIAHDAYMERKKELLSS